MDRGYIIPRREDIKNSIRLAEEYGCAFEYNDFYIPAVLDDSKLQEEIIEFYARYRSDFSKDTMHGAFLDITVHSSDSLIREASLLRMRQSMDIAKRMGLRGVVFHTGRIGGFRAESYLKQWHDLNLRYFSELAEAYPEQKIYMENMFDEAPDVMAGLARDMCEIGNFGICLDYAHAALTSCPQEEWIEELAPFIRHIHINDNNLKDDLHQPVGDGKIDWQWFDMLIRKHDVKATVLVEVNGCSGQEKSLKYMEQHKLYPWTADES